MLAGSETRTFRLSRNFGTDAFLSGGQGAHVVSVKAETPLDLLTLRRLEQNSFRVPDSGLASPPSVSNNSA